MRKFCVRWWVANPDARYSEAIAGIDGDIGLSVRFVREAGPEDVRHYLRAWLVSLPVENLPVQ